MNLTTELKNLTHAYVLEGESKRVLDELVSILEKNHGVSFMANPDVMIEKFQSLNIESARFIKAEALKKKLGNGKRIFIIVTESMTREASNALLKTLEEPAGETHFFIIVPSSRRILPTILSRVRLISCIDYNGSLCNCNEILDPEKFLKQTKSERIASVKEIMVKIEKEEISKGEVQTCIEGLLVFIYKKGSKKNLVKLSDVASYSRDQSSSLKMILEYFALEA